MTPLTTMGCNGLGIEEGRRDWLKRNVERTLVEESVFGKCFGLGKAFDSVRNNKIEHMISMKTCNSVTFYFVKNSLCDISRKWILPNMIGAVTEKRRHTMLRQHKARVNSHQR